MKPKYVLFVGLDKATRDELRKRLPRQRIAVINSNEDFEAQRMRKKFFKEKYFETTKENAIRDLIFAKRSRAILKVVDNPEKNQNKINAKPNAHIVCAEETGDMASVIAANYAYSIDADICWIPKQTRDASSLVLDKLGKLREAQASDRHALAVEIKGDLERIIPQELLNKKKNGVTFIGSGIPYGCLIQDCETCHFFIYPNLGLQVFHSLWTDLSYNGLVRAALLIDPVFKDSEAKEMATFLEGKGTFTYLLSDRDATVYEVTQAIEHFPYDFLYICSHCGEIPGRRCKVEFPGFDGKKHILIVDRAETFGLEPGTDMVNVHIFSRFVEMDGISWGDDEGKTRINAGQLVLDYTKAEDGKDLRMIEAKAIPRVEDCVGITVHRGNYMFAFHKVASMQYPIIFNNACVSYHEAADRFIFAGARAYIGTLYSVLGAEAEEICKRTIIASKTKRLSQALWQAQSDFYQNNEIIRPYIFVGSHLTNFRFKGNLEENKKHLASRLLKGHRDWTKKRKENTDQAIAQGLDRAMKSSAHYIKKFFGVSI